MRASDFEIHNYSKLDKILSKLCEMVVKGQKSDKDYGMVAAAVVDPDNQIVARLNRPGTDGKRIHAEHAAMEDYKSKYGPIPQGSIVITTLSPCNEHMDERDGPSCTSIINNSTVKKVYCGYMDPTQDDDTRQFNLMETADRELRTRCKQFADTFLDNVHENFADGISEARSHPEQNTKYQTGWAELGAWADKNNVWLKPHQWAISMTYMPKLGINPGQGISEDTPRGIYFYPFHWAYSVKKDKEALPWADNAPYIQLFQYSTGAGLREPNQIPLAKAVAELKKYGITDQDIAAEKENDPSISTYGLLVWCLGRKFDDNRRVSILNKVLRNLGYNYMIDNGKGWIAINEPNQGVVLNPTIINKVVTFNNYTRKKEQGVAENFADGRHPEDKGDSKRYNVPTKGSVSSLRKIAKQGGRRGQLAHWMANMKSGHKK